jgi:uroporphyrinogen-III synthase
MDGLQVGVTGARRGYDLVTLLERRGARPQWGPTLEADLAADDGRITAETDAALAGDPPWLAATTGAGLRAWLAAAERSGCAETLRGWMGGARIAARGAKAVGALRAEGVEAEFVSPTETDADLAGWLEGVVGDGEAVVVQQHGVAAGLGAYERLAARADVRTVAPYRCPPPTDPAPAYRLIAAACEGQLGAVLATSAPAVHNLFQLAEQTGRAEALREAFAGPLAAAAVGPVTAAAFEEHRAPVRVMPHRSRTAELVRALEGWEQRRGVEPAAGGCGAAPVWLDPIRRRLHLPDRSVDLAVREFAVVAALVRRPGVVCPPQLLAREGWGHRARDDAAQVRGQLARVRRKLGPAGDAFVTVRSVGYRFDPSRLTAAG